MIMARLGRRTDQPKARRCLAFVPLAGTGQCVIFTYWTNGRSSMPQ